MTASGSLCVDTILAWDGSDADKAAGQMLVVVHAQEVPSDRSPNDYHRTAVASSDDGG